MWTGCVKCLFSPAKMLLFVLFWTLSNPGSATRWCTKCTGQGLVHVMSHGHPLWVGKCPNQAPGAPISSKKSQKQLILSYFDVFVTAPSPGSAAWRNVECTGQGPAHVVGHARPLCVGGHTIQSRSAPISSKKGQNSSFRAVLLPRRPVLHLV